MSQGCMYSVQGAEVFGRFVHDVVAPSLSAIGLQLDLLRTDFERHPVISRRAGEIQAEVERLMEQVRSFSRFSGVSGLNVKISAEGE